MKLKEKYYTDRMNNCISGSKNIWQVLKEVSGKTQSNNNISEICDDGRIITQPKEIAEKFNEFYINIGPNLANNLQPVAYDENEMGIWNNTELTVPDLSVDVINKIIQSLKNKHSGPNNKSNNFLKQMIQETGPCISKLATSSFRDGVFPQKCKIAEVEPIFKSGSAMEVGNYRPISILSAISRVLEKFMKQALESHLIETKFFYEPHFWLQK